MGVRGLTTYVQHNQHLFLKDHILHDTQLVIDGHSLCAQLYRRLTCFPAFGGDYDKFAACVRKFFKNLKKCNISSFVLFDGSYEIRKLKTAFSRLRSKIRGAAQLDPVTQSSLSIFPVFLRDVLKEILVEMKVAYTICEFEADEEIAALARHLNCPVLSYDSDFFIYNVLYVPFNTLELKPACFDDEGSSFYGLECKIYKVEYFTNSFGGLKEDLLPLFATLLGNDYIQKRVFRNFFTQLKLPKGKKKSNDLQKSISALLKWLQNESLETAIDKILGRMKKTNKGKILHLIKKGMDGYYHRHCRSLSYFNVTPNNIEKSNMVLPEKYVCNDDNYNSEMDDTSSDDESLTDEDKSDIGEDIVTENKLNDLPEWFSQKIRKFEIPQLYIDLYTIQLYFTYPQAEDYNDVDAYLCVVDILRYSFDILTDFSQEYFIFVSREKDHEYKKITIGQEYAVTRPLHKQFSQLSKEELRICFNHFLAEKLGKLDISVLESLPSNFSLVMITILFWVSKCNVPKSYIYSLFISYIMLNIIDEKTGTFRGQYFFNTKHAKKLEELKTKTIEDYDNNELFLNKNKVIYEDCLLAASVLLQHFELSNEIKKKPKSYDVQKIHKFAQFQCCLLQFNCLNNLCGKVYDSSSYSKFYNGTFVYNISTKLDSRSDAYLFIGQYLKGATTVLRFFGSLCSLYEKCAEQLSLVTCVNTGRKKRRGGKKSKKRDKDMSFLCENFESEVFI